MRNLVKLFISLIVRLFLLRSVFVFVHVYLCVSVSVLQCMHMRMYTYAYQIHKQIVRLIFAGICHDFMHFLLACMCLCVSLLVCICERALLIHDIHMQCIFVELAKPAFDHVLEVKCAM